MKKKPTKNQIRIGQKQWYPRGWNRERAKKVIGYYESQSDEDGVAEYEAAMKMDDLSAILVPTKLIPKIRKLISLHQEK
jgi:hypothetical protein